MVKVVIVAFLLAILIALGSGLVFLIRDSGKSHRTVRALTWRIGLSVLLIVLLVLGYLTGIVQPHDLGQ